MSTENADSERLDRPLQSVRFVGPATAAALRQAGYDTTAITDKRVSYRRLVKAGVNPGVAAKIRREHSLSWSFRSGGDLDRRSAQIRGLGRAEAEWVAASAGDWEQATDESSTDTVDETTDAGTADAGTAGRATDSPAIAAAERTPWPTHGKPSAEPSADGGGAISDEAAWRARSTPTPVSELDTLDSATVDQLAEAGIISVRSLATVNVERVADVLEVSEAVVDEWYQAARAVYEG